MLHNPSIYLNYFYSIVGQMDSLRLIEAVKNHPELYDRKNKNYTNMEVKRDVWIAIAEEFNEPEENIRTRWRNLRDACKHPIQSTSEKLLF